MAGQPDSYMSMSTLDWDGKADMSITAPGPLAFEAVDDSPGNDTGKRAMVPAAVFALSEAMLVAETVSVIVLKQVEFRDTAGMLITLLLSVGLLGNFVCGTIAARAAGPVRHLYYAD